MLPNPHLKTSSIKTSLHPSTASHRLSSPKGSRPSKQLTMNTLPTFARACARRTTILTSSSTTSSNLASITRPPFQKPQQPRLLSTTTTTTPETPPTANLPPSPPQSQPTLSTTSPYLQTGTVSRAGTMKNCIQITQHLQTYDSHLQKHYTRPHRLLIHDPNPPGFLVEGDVIEFGLFSEAERAARLERKKLWDEKLEGVKRRGVKKGERTRWRGPKMVVRRVVTAFGVGVDERMERIVRMQEEGRGAEKVVPASRKGRVGKQHGSAKVAG